MFRHSHHPPTRDQRQEVIQLDLQLLDHSYLSAKRRQSSWSNWSDGKNTYGSGTGAIQDRNPKSYIPKIHQRQAVYVDLVRSSKDLPLV
ncbi:hypothetical protein AVEN_215785-1 [Araneus ventricosus]|uniref:Uncharacterized protein n=1 Tax=Araneus ventricosus TaxID=182803 RepID=A0A4Y2SUU4_ARAVE|nr:hypothetical protein AVEN_8959-1 [Araneus ventricosus]GBN92114.1 hypothetical protein AVEN_215785-1 [Araneus ventricosus]